MGVSIGSSRPWHRAIEIYVLWGMTINRFMGGAEQRFGTF